jgi:type IV secretory pathway VirB2 component (pilin)
MRTAAIGIVAAGYAWAAGSTAPFSTISLVYVLIPGVAVAAIAYGWPPERIPPPDKLDITGMSYWAVAVAALFEWEASAYRDNSLPWHPSLTDLINPLLGPHVVKSAAILVWMLVGWALVRR